MAEAKVTEKNKNMGGKPTGWPRPAPKLAKSLGLNKIRMGILIGLALGGIFGGYLLGRYVNPAPPPAPPAPAQSQAPAAAPAPAPAAPIADQNAAQAPVKSEPNGDTHFYEQRLPRDIVVEKEGVITRTALPEPGKSLDTGGADVTAPEPAKPAAAKDDTKPTQPKPAPKETASLPPAHLVRAIPDYDSHHSGTADAPAWRKNAVAVAWSDKPKIVIVIDDLGLDRPRTRRTIALPGPLTLSFLAYAEELPSQTAKGRAAGHELMMHVPMEPGAGNVDPGPNVLLTGMPSDEVLKSLKWNLDQMHGYVGINNHMGSKFTSDKDGMQVVVKELKKRGLLFLDSLTSGHSVAHDVARDAGIPFAIRNVFLDHDDDEAAIKRQLAQVERVSRETGLAIAIGHPREKTLNVLEAWLKTLDRKGFQLVPISSVVRVANRAG